MRTHPPCSPEFAYFFFHSWLRDWTLKRLSRTAAKPVVQLSTSLELLLGALAGAFAQIFTIPVAVIATRQQLHTSDNGSKSPGLLDTAREIIAEDGVTGLWTGLKPGLVLTVNPAITYGVFERVKGILIAAQVAAGAEARLTPGRSFLIGILSKTLATVVTYPYIFVSRFSGTIRDTILIGGRSLLLLPGKGTTSSQAFRRQLERTSSGHSTLCFIFERHGTYGAHLVRQRCRLQ